MLIKNDFQTSAVVGGLSIWLIVESIFFLGLTTWWFVERTKNVNPPTVEDIFCIDCEELQMSRVNKDDSDMKQLIESLRGTGSDNNSTCCGKASVLLDLLVEKVYNKHSHTDSDCKL